MFNLPLMPLLCGDNPLTNEVPSKFLRLTDYQLYILRQWADGKFYNEIRRRLGARHAGHPSSPIQTGPTATGRELDRGVLTNSARRRVLSGRRGRLDHAQPVDLSGAVPPQGRSGLLRLPPDRRAGQRQVAQQPVSERTTSRSIEVR